MIHDSALYHCVTLIHVLHWWQAFKFIIFWDFHLPYSNFPKLLPFQCLVVRWTTWQVWFGSTSRHRGKIGRSERNFQIMSTFSPLIIQSVFQNYTYPWCRSCQDVVTPKYGLNSIFSALCMHLFLLLISHFHFYL